MANHPGPGGRQTLIMRRSTVLLLAIAVLQVHAEQPPLGRLFLDPQQRTELDSQRRHNRAFLPNAEDQTAGQTLNGEVRRSDGRYTRWVNGKASQRGPAPRIPVGDTLYPATGERRGILGEGRLTIRQQPPAR